MIRQNSKNLSNPDSVEVVFVQSSNIGKKNGLSTVHQKHPWQIIINKVN